MPMNLGAGSGRVLEALDAAGVPYVGPSAKAAELAGDKSRYGTHPCMCG